MQVRQALPSADKLSCSGLCVAVRLAFAPPTVSAVQGKVKYACSEEVAEPVNLQGERFSVAFAPLSGFLGLKTRPALCPDRLCRLCRAR